MIYFFAVTTQICHEICLGDAHTQPRSQSPLPAFSRVRERGTSTGGPTVGVRLVHTL